VGLGKVIRVTSIKERFFRQLKSLYHKAYMGLTSQCYKYQLYKKNGFVRIHNITESTSTDIAFTIKGYTEKNIKKLPDYFIDDVFQATLLVKFEDELVDSSWSYPYGIIELKNANFAFPYVIHRVGNVVVKQATGDCEYCLCQPRYLLSYLSTLLPKKQSFDSVIFLPLPFFENYYHWTIETLPRLKLIADDERFNRLPIVLPKQRCPEFVYESIALAGFSDRIIHLDKGSYHAKQLFIPTLYTNRSELSLDAVQWLNDKILGGRLKEDSGAKELNYERIFISREDADSRRILNTGEMDELLNTFGITKVVMSDYSVVEQARIFKNANLIVGIHGAALANVVYCNSEATLLEIFMDGWFTKAFYNLARAREMAYGCLLCEQDKGNIHVDTNKLEELINKAINES